MKSSDVMALYAEYKKINPGDLSPIEQNKLKKSLDSIEKIGNKKEAEAFLRLLALVRESEAMAIDGLGPEAIQTIVGAFAGGDEGVYAADADKMNARFIFELVQNVDDCKYSDVGNCKLDIIFNIEEDKIVLKYNEIGFQPENVIAITGLGNSTKNHKKAQNRKSEEALDQSDLQEIGEKGIGFKSIFGLAQEVIIKSQYFFFSIVRDNFFVPIIGDYKKFEYSDCTELELKLDDGLVNELYGFLKNKYDQEEAIINENPILFLNKLTEIRYYASESDYFGFSVSRRDISKDTVGEATTIEFFSSDSERNKSIEAYRYTRNIEYSVPECQARYGNQEETTRKHKIIVIAPRDPSLIKCGRIYSFFATSELVFAPFIIHAPFKLNSGRTKIDQQSQSLVSKNEWFRRTMSETISMVQDVFEHLPQLVGSQIYHYVPAENLFDRGNAIYSNRTSRTNILHWKIFPCMDGSFLSMDEVCIIDYKATKQKLLRISELLNITRALLDIDYDSFSTFKDLGVYCINNVEKALLYKALANSLYTEECLDYLKKYKPDSDEELDWHPTLSFRQIEVLSKYPSIVEWINNITISKITDKQTCGINCTDSASSDDVKKIIEFCEDHKEGIDEDFIEYVGNVSYCQMKIESPIFLDNCVFGFNILEDFAYLYHKICPKDKLFYPLLSIEGVSEKIDLLCQKGDEISDYDFLSQLMDYRKYQRKVLGDQYRSILDLIEKAGTDTERFLPEILQNIDDCMYEEEPHVRIRIDDIRGEKKLRVEYNEVGFTREQIRAITAIGDSTKKNLLKDATGEKGVGFKSVFSICKEVTIESGTIQFTLSNEKPTVPAKIKKIEKVEGTTMVYTLDARFAKSVEGLLSDEQNVIRYILCLKQVKSLVINQKIISIKDVGDKRSITYDGGKHDFFCLKFPVIISSQQALHERRKSKNVSPNQMITYIIPYDEFVEDYNVYSTFPTQEIISVPIIIDMPLELDTARERAINCYWNSAVYREIGAGLLKVYEGIKRHFKMKIAQFIPLPDFRLIGTKYFVPAEVINRIPEMKLFKLAFVNDYTSLVEGAFSDPLEYKLYREYNRELGDSLQNVLLENDEESKKRLQKIFNDDVNIREFADVCKTLDSLFKSITPENVFSNKKENFREEIYSFLSGSDYYHIKSSIDIIKTWAIIPVVDQKQTKYIKYSDDIYYSKNSELDSSKYKLLKTKEMSVEIFNKIYGDDGRNTIKEFSEDIILTEIFNEIVLRLKTDDLLGRAEDILDLFNTEKELFLRVIETRNDFPYKDICFVSRMGEVISFEEAFIVDEENSQGCLDQVIVGKEYFELAEALEVNSISTIDDCRKISGIQIGIEELRQLKTNEHLTRSKDLFKSIYTTLDEYKELSDGKGFFELSSLVSESVRTDTGQSHKQIMVTDTLLEKYHKLINEVSLSEAPIEYVLNFQLEDFKGEDVISEIEDELQLRKESKSIVIILGLLQHTFNAELGTRVPCCVKTQDTRLLLIDNKIVTDYDIISVLKEYLLKFFKTEININRTLNVYTRLGYENISTIQSDNQAVEKATHLYMNVNTANVESVKDFMCKPLLVDGITYGGYAKTCPLCGVSVHTELTGLRIYKTKIDGILLPIICCTNCHENLKYATIIEIDKEKLFNGVLSMRCIINNYEWQINDMTIRLGHRAVIKYMNKKRE